MAMEFVLKNQKNRSTQIFKFLLNDKTRINWIYWGNERYKKVFRKINKKEEIFCDFLIEEKISVSW